MTSATDIRNRNGLSVKEGGDLGEVLVPTSSLRTIAERTVQLLKERQPSKIDGVRPELHPLPPFIHKAHWTDLGDAIVEAERQTKVAIPGHQWISLRCDGTGFSKLTKRLKRAKILEQGYSTTFGNIMVKCCRALMTKFNAKCGYTQSDEITVLIAPTSIVRGEQQPHIYSGRVQKLVSLASSIVTAQFNHEIANLCGKSALEDIDQVGLIATFDCRLGAYDTQEEATGILLWRGYDCGVNGVSDAVFHCKGKIEGAGAVSKLGKDLKIQWLKDHGILPLQPHQRDGTYLVRKKVLTNATNHKTGEPVQCIRSQIVSVTGNVLNLCKNDSLFPIDGEQP